uniref:Uncharacterized protein n=1 Tax=Fundulus heteroclitus TaxID=8078 RepID=A0A3Q2PKN5_FUNHE
IRADSLLLMTLSPYSYQGPLLEDGALDSAVIGGAASPEFTKLCAWIISELRLYHKLEENVHATNCEFNRIPLKLAAAVAGGTEFHTTPARRRIDGGILWNFFQNKAGIAVKLEPFFEIK